MSPNSPLSCFKQITKSYLHVLDICLILLLLQGWLPQRVIYLIKGSQLKLILICRSSAYGAAILHPKTSFNQSASICTKCFKALNSQFMFNQIKLEWNDNRLRRKWEHMADVTESLTVWAQTFLFLHPVALIVLISVITLNQMIAVTPCIM